MAPRIMVSNLAPLTSIDDLRRLYSAYGSVCNIRMVRDPFTHASRGTAYVEMATAAGAAAGAAATNGQTVVGRAIQAKVCSDQPTTANASAQAWGRPPVPTFDRRSLALARAEQLFARPGA